MNNLVITTGSNGYVAKSVINKLCELDINVVQVSRSPTPSQVSVEALYEICKGIDEVDCNITLIHTAGHAHNLRRLNYDLVLEYLDFTFNVLSILEHFANVDVIFLSSIAIYGRASAVEKLTNNSLIRPNSLYGLEKVFVEKLICDKAKSKTITYSIFRLPMIYGKYAKGNPMKILKALEKGVPLPFKNVRQNRRSVLNIDLLVDKVVSRINSQHKDNLITFLKDEEPLSTREIIQKVGDLHGLQPKFFVLNWHVLWLCIYLFFGRSSCESLLGDLVIED